MLSACLLDLLSLSCAGCPGARAASKLNPCPVLRSRLLLGAPDIGRLFSLPEASSCLLVLSSHPVSHWAGPPTEGQVAADCRKWGVYRPGSRGCRMWLGHWRVARVDPPREEEKMEKSQSKTRSESAWQLVPLPPPPRGPIPHTGLSSELYIPPSWTAAPAEGPFTNSLHGPALAQPLRLVRGDGDKPVSGPQQDLCSRRTGALGAG